MRPTRAQIVERARRHVGHREVTPNRSPLIDEWIALCGLNPADPRGPYSWCAAFASWCIGEKQPGALKLGRMFPETTSPIPGDLMFFPTDDRGSGHVGIVVEPPFDATDPEVLCVEGNSNDGVRYVRRLRAEVTFSRSRSYGPWFPEAPLVRVQRAGTR